MLIAYNNDIEFRSRWYHIQTEDNGLKDGHITTTVFYSGQILDSKTTSYLDAIRDISDTEEQNRIIKNAMTTQHKYFYTKLYEGTYEALVNASQKAGTLHNNLHSVSGGDVAKVSSSSSGGGVKAAPPSALRVSSLSSSSAAAAAGMSGGAPSGVRMESPSSSRLGKPDILRASQQLPSASKSLGSFSPLSVGGVKSSTGLPLRVGASGDAARGGGRQQRLTRALTQSQGVASEAFEARAYRGVLWPKEDLSVDSLVAMLLSGMDV